MAIIILQTVATIAAFISAMCLFYASLAFPHEEQSWSGTTPKELSWKRRQAILKWVGIPAAIIAVGSQLGGHIPANCTLKSSAHGRRYLVVVRSPQQVRRILNN
jgi:hypothetical protein